MKAHVEKCGGCGGPCEFETSVPSVLWNRVVRPLGGSEYLCLSCIVKAFAIAGVSFTGELYGGDFHGLPIAVEINGAVSTAPLELNEENNRLRVEQQLWLNRLRHRNQSWEAAHPEQKLVGKCRDCGLGYLTCAGDGLACHACGGVIVRDDL